MAVKNLEKDPAPENTYDVCIIGSGPAGMTLCAELANSGKSIIVLESGGMKKHPLGDALRKVESVGNVSIRDSSRERVVGGTSTAWAGLSSPLDKIDVSLWPISYGELENYYKRLSVYGFAQFSDFSTEQMDELRKNADFTLQSKKIEEKIFIAKDPAWNFGKELKHLFESPNIDLYTNATVTELVSHGHSITSVAVRTTTGLEHRISAKIYILATGGIESVRLLLLSRSSSQNGLGNEHDQVGRYIMNHPKNNYGLLHLHRPAKNLTHLFGYLHNGWAKSAGVRVSEDTQESLTILNSYVRLEPVFPWTDSGGVANLIIITKKFKLFLAWWKKMQKRIVGLRDWNETGDDAPQKRFSWGKAIICIVKDIPAVTSYCIHRLFSHKKISVKTLRLRNFMEMAPNTDNRITLSGDKDMFGRELPKITLNVSENDKRSLIELHRILGEEVRDKKIGVLESDLANAHPWPITMEASHHLGGTIMGKDPKTSVVDPNLRVHSIKNLFICSGSVFPTSGCANPTFTICALAVRLAEHLGNV